MGIDGSDWDYINEHMGGHDEDGLPNFMSEPGFSDEEYEAKEESSYFETFKEAMAWAKNHPGQVIIRAPDGQKFMIKEEKQKIGSLFKTSREFYKRISYWRVGHLNVELMKNVLAQLSFAELKSLKPLLDIGLESTYRSMKACEFHNKDCEHEYLQADDIQMMLEEVNFLLERKFKK